MTRSAFLTLVRSGLWNVPADPAPFRGMNAADWEEVYRFARTQALLAITFDGIAGLPPEVRPPRPLYLQWVTLVARIEQANSPAERTGQRRALPQPAAPPMRRHRHLHRQGGTSHRQPPAPAPRRPTRRRSLRQAHQLLAARHPHREPPLRHRPLQVRAVRQVRGRLPLRRHHQEYAPL